MRTTRFSFVCYWSGSEFNDQYAGSNLAAGSSRTKLQVSDTRMRQLNRLQAGTQRSSNTQSEDARSSMEGLGTSRCNSLVHENRFKLHIKISFNTFQPFNFNTEILLLVAVVVLSNGVAFDSRYYLTKASH